MFPDIVRRRHPRESGDPCQRQAFFLDQLRPPHGFADWIPAYAGMTVMEQTDKESPNCAAAGLLGGFTIPGSKSDVRRIDYQKYITIEPGKRGGKPCIRGMRITVYEALDYLASGMTEAEVLTDFPDLTSEDVKACLAFVADRERKLATIPP